MSFRHYAFESRLKEQLFGVRWTQVGLAKAELMFRYVGEQPVTVKGFWAKTTMVQENVHASHGNQNRAPRQVRDTDFRSRIYRHQESNMTAFVRALVLDYLYPTLTIS